MKNNPLRDLLTRTATDRAFREEFIRDPAAVLRRAGIQVPEGKTIKVLENSDEQIYLVLPTNADDQPANWDRQERPAPGEKKDAGKLLMEWTEEGLVLKGRIDSETARALREQLDRVSGNLTLDFTDVAYMSSSGLSVLLATQNRLKTVGKELLLYNAAPPIRNVFALMNVDTLFQFVYPVDMEFLPWAVT